VFSAKPSALLEIFIVLANHPELEGIRAGTVRQIRRALPLIDEHFRSNPECQRLFMDIFRLPQGLTRVLRRMHKYGILGAYLPSFGRVEGLMQYDLFHIYTVDDHTLMVIRNLRRLAIREYDHEFPQYSQLFRSLAKPEVLYLAALFHDIAKGRGGDHSVLGATDAYDFCKQHGMSEYHANMVAWLVTNHLVMSLTAQRKDISDPEVINEFAHQVMDVAHLDFLYLLTIADIRATNPNLWNFWKQTLLADLYHASRQALRRGLGTQLDNTAIIETTKNDTMALLGMEGYSLIDVETVWRHFPDDYFIRYSADDIALHVRNILSQQDPDKPLVVIYEPRGYGGMAIFIHTRARDALFADITAALDQMGLNIADARIISSRNGMTLDTYIVIDDEHQEINHNRVEEIYNLLIKQISADTTETSQVMRHLTRHQKHFQSTTSVTFRDDQQDKTVIIISTSDRPGLLASIGKVLHEYHIQILNAKIATIGTMVEDIFFVSNKSGHALDNKTRQQLEKDIVAALDS
jgi:[protein-PII] uridylyltransferase